MARLALSLLGPLHITLEGQIVSGFTYSKARALLVFLAMEADRAHRRDALVGLLWPDMPEAAARTNLRQALAKLREALGEGSSASAPFLLVTRDTVQFNPESQFSLDSGALQAEHQHCQLHPHLGLDRCHLCAARMERAAALYRGHFLEQLTVPDSAPFEEWALLKREQLRQFALEMLAHLAAYHERRGSGATAQKYARRLLELDSWQENAHRQLMRLLVVAGQRNAALAQYETCRAALAEGLGVKPDAETQLLYEQIKSGESVQAWAGEATLRNWPRSATPLVGRESELAQLGDLLSNPECRLLTIVGPGGVGKTRLALAAAAGQAWAFSQGAVFAPLASLTSSLFLDSTLAQALGLSLSGQAKAREQLLLALQESEILLVLDNLEHLLPGSAGSHGEPPEAEEALGLLAEILRRAPGVQILVTSIERLNLQEEWLFELRGLAYPMAEDATLNYESHGAMKLFTYCARRVQPGFSLSESGRQAAIRLCRLVDGLPLALELAAAWVRALTCEEIADKIESEVGFLSTSIRDVPERHRSVQAVFDHAWKLLTAQEREAFQALTVFRGGFGRAAAEQVAGISTASLAALVDKSLLLHDHISRYSLHPLSIQYGRRQLAAAGAEAAACARHAAYFMQLANTAQALLKGPEQMRWLEHLEDEHDNLRAALAWTRASAPSDCVQLAGALWRFWHMHGHLREGREWLNLALAGGGQPLARARALRGAAGLAWHQGDYSTARTLAEQSVALWREQDDGAGLGDALTVLGMAAGYQGDHDLARKALEEAVALARLSHEPWSLAYALYYAADREAALRPTDTMRGLLEESLALFQRIGDRWGLALPLHGLGYLAYFEGDYPAAHRWLNQALRIRREIGDRWLVAQTANTLGEVARLQADYERAARHYRESLGLYQALDAPGRAAMMTHNLGYVALRCGEGAHAQRLFADSLTVFHRLGDRWGIAACLEALASVQPEARRSACLLGAAEGLRVALDAPLSPADRMEYDHTLSDVRARLEPLAYSSAWAEGRAMEMESAVAFALEGQRSPSAEL